MKFSANLGFLWNDRPLADAIRAAKNAGFDAVEFHWPYDEPIADVKAAVRETGLPVLGINTVRGNLDAGENGLSALVGREIDARAAIDQAIEYARQVGAGKIHVMAGFASGALANATFVSNLKYACQSAPDLGFLIEPLNRYDAPGYFLQTTDQAIEIINQVAMDNLALMFDCYHVQLMEGDLSNRLKTLLPRIGHFQFASVPDRGTPDHGEVNYADIFQLLSNLGYEKPLGAEYKPNGETDQSLDWLRTAKAN